MRLHKKKVKPSVESQYYALGRSSNSDLLKLRDKKQRLSDLPFKVLDQIIAYCDPKSVLNIRKMNRKLRICASKRLWHTVTLTNLPHRRQNKDDLHIFINKYSFRSFFEDVYMGKLEHQLAWCKSFHVLYKEDDLVDLAHGTTIHTAKNLNYVPMQHFFHWFLGSRASDVMAQVEQVKLSVNIGTKLMGEALRSLCWSLPTARVQAILWVPGFSGICARDLITPNMADIEIKCDLLNFDMNIFGGEFAVPKKCEVFRIGLEDDLRKEHRLRVVPKRPKIQAETLKKWFKRCDQHLHTLELAHLDVENPNAIDWSPASFAKVNTAGLVLREVEFNPPKQAVVMQHVNMLERININTRPLMELIVPHVISLVLSCARANTEQLDQLSFWFKFHRPTLQKITITDMTLPKIKVVLAHLRELRFKMVDILDPVLEPTFKFEDLAPECLQFAVLKIQMKNVSLDSATKFLQRLYEPNAKTHLSSVRVVDGPFTKNTLPNFVLDHPRQFQLLETRSRVKRVTVFEKASAPPTPTSI